MACTGYKIANLELFNSFGKIRNQIIHFSVPRISLAKQTLKYAFQVVESAVNDWWDTTILEYALDYDEESSEYIFEELKNLNIQVEYKLDKNNNLEKIRKNG